MDSLISIINKLQDVFNTIGADTIQLPQIIVVGNQSAGKSSVIEAIVGRDFLPRGTGIVTRCPLILQLIQIEEKDSRDKSEEEGTAKLNEWAKFLHTKDKIYTDFAEVCKEIELETERVTGRNKRISSKPITLKIYSNKLVNLTLVDLPGITKIPVADQPEDIEHQVCDLILKHIENPKSIILAVTPANTDFATSEALKLARKVDPDGVRTLAVLTKLDLMDAGTDAMDVLRGLVIPVKLGIIGVVNRSQQDIMNNKSIHDALKSEIAFLQKKYPLLASRNGSAYLITTLNRLLIGHIQEHLPDLQAKVKAKEAEQRTLRNSLGDELETPAKKTNKLIKVVTEFVTIFGDAVEGTMKDIETSELIGGARICEIFDEKFSDYLDSIDALEGLTNEEIRNAIRNSTGLRAALGVPQLALEYLVKKQLKKLHKKAPSCARWTYNELEIIIRECAAKIEKNISLFPNLLKEILHFVRERLDYHLKFANLGVQIVLDSELAYVNFKHPNFIDAYNKLVSPNGTTANDNRKSDDGSESKLDSDSQCEAVKDLIESYFIGVREQLKDIIPKITVRYLIIIMREKLQDELIEELNKPELLDELLYEDKCVPLRRKEADEMLAALNKAQEIIGEIDHHRV